MRKGHKCTGMNIYQNINAFRDVIKNNKTEKCGNFEDKKEGGGCQVKGLILPMLGGEC